MISVIINVYNGQNFIKKCLDSVINQTYKNLEILIINDGSTDNTLKICEGYNDSRIKIITTKNLGLAMSRNVGIENANGDYLYFVDVDDLIELDTIEYLYNLCKKYNCLISTCKSMDIYNYDFEVKQEKEKIDLLSSKDFLKKILLAENNCVATWNKLIKKELFKNVRFEKRFSDDIVTTHKIIMNTDKIVCSNQIKYLYYKHIGSICSSKKEILEWNIDMYNAFLERYNFINEKYPNFIENNYSILELLTRLYLRKNNEIINYLNKNGAINLYKKFFSFKIFKCKIKFRQKIKILLFRISPKLYINIIKLYLKIFNKNEW